MTIVWSLLRERICDKALEKCGVLGPGDPFNPDDRNICLEALDGILKNLLWYGYSWPKTVSSSTPLSCLANIQTKTLPADYYTGAVFKYVDVTNPLQPLEIELPIQTGDQWRDIPNKLATAVRPDRVFVDNFNIAWLWPIQTVAITVNLYYQAVIADSVVNSNTPLDSPWMLGLVYGVAAEVGDEFNVPDNKLARFEAKWAMQRTLGIMNEGAPLPDRVSVDDYSSYQGDWRGIP